MWTIWALSQLISPATKHKNIHRQYGNKLAQLYSNKTLFINIDIWIWYNFMCHKIFFFFCFFSTIDSVKTFLVHRQYRNRLWVKLGFLQASELFSFSNNYRSFRGFYGSIVDPTSPPSTILLSRINHRPYQDTSDVQIWSLTCIGGKWNGIRKE